MILLSSRFLAQKGGSLSSGPWPRRLPIQYCWFWTLIAHRHHPARVRTSRSFGHVLTCL